MPTHPLTKVIQQLRQVARGEEADRLTDGQLLERFLARQDEAAFEALVRRHGPMVLGTCRRVIGNGHDAEDAFQATFLVLVRKAASVRPREQVGNWLYGVAYRTALEARSKLLRRHARERQGKDMARFPSPTGEPSPDLLPLLDQELNRLPDRYRVPVVLCELEGRTRKEVARQLGIPEGTLSSRLATARRMLARRLSRYGPMISGGTLAAALGEGAASACVPASLVVSTVQSASLLAAGPAAAAGAIPAEVAALTEGVLKTMLLTKLKIAAVVVLALAGLAGGGRWFAPGIRGAERQEAQGQPHPREDPSAAPQEAKPDAVKEEMARLQGAWTGVEGEMDGNPIANQEIRKLKVVIKGDELTFNDKRGGAFTVNPARTPKEMFLTPREGPAKGVTQKAIYALEGDRLKLCLNNLGKKPPTEFATRQGDGLSLLVLERAREGGAAKPAVGGARGPLTEERKQRLVRWSLSTETTDGEDYVRLLQALGAFLAVPDPTDNTRYRVIRDLAHRPARGQREDPAKLGRLFWVESNPGSVAKLSSALGLKPAPACFVVFFPEYLEDEMHRKELAFAGRKEEGIQQTRFQVRRGATGYEIRVVCQTPKADQEADGQKPADPGPNPSEPEKVRKRAWQADAFQHSIDELGLCVRVLGIMARTPQAFTPEERRQFRELADFDLGMLEKGLLPRLEQGEAIEPYGRPVDAREVRQLIERARKARDRVPQAEAPPANQEKPGDSAEKKGGQGEATASLEGVVTFNGKPIARGQVAFHPEKGKPVSVSVEAGRYAARGVPVGSLRVTVRAKGVPVKYAAPETSGLVLEVREGRNQYDLSLQP